MAVNEIYRASFEFTNPSADGSLFTTAHYRTSAVSTPISNSAEGQEIADDLVADVVADYLDLIEDTFTFVGVNVIGITDPLVGVSASSGSPGLLTTESLSMRSAPVVKLLTGIRGRSFRGRMFLMAPTEANQDGGVMGSAYITDLDTFMASIEVLVGASSNVYRQTIYSPTLSTPPTIFIDNLVTEAVVNPTLGSQRSRQTV